MTGQASGGSGSSPFGEIIRLVMGAQERSLTVAQAWSESLQQLVRDQAEPFGKMFQEWNAAFLRLLEAAPGTAANRPEQGST
ncbi:MAG TPA: hypothetical protein VK942_13945 [Actinomycetes bacterium]|nr:hypothetical protein [Actinomycetes bacterium]